MFAMRQKHFYFSFLLFFTFTFQAKFLFVFIFPLFSIVSSIKFNVMMVVKKKNNSCMFIWLFVLIHQLKETSFGVEFLMISKMRIIFLYFIGAQSTMSEHFFFLFFFSPVCIVDISSCIHCSYCSLSSVFFFSSSFLQIETYVSAIIHLFH